MATTVYGVGKTIAPGDRIILPQVSEQATPTLAFGDGDSGWYEHLDDQIFMSIGGSQRTKWTVSLYNSTISNGFSLPYAAATETIPVFSFNTDPDTGIGRRAADVGVLIAGGVNTMEFGEAGAAPLVGFYGTAATAQQTGVAVSAAGVHAALVNLGLITA